MELFKGYVRTNGKRCIDKYKGKSSEDLLRLTDVKDLESYAGVLADDAILVDIDDQKEAEKLLSIVEDLQLKCRVYATKKGKHFVFKCPKDFSYNPIKKPVPIGLTVDIKCGSKCGLEVLKYEGVEREILYDIYEGEEYEEVPRWLLPARGGKVPNFGELGEGDGRNQTLYCYIMTLEGWDFSKDEAIGVLKIINKYMLAVPLSDEELETICRDEAFGKPVFFKNKQFQHADFAKYIKNECHVVKINNNLYVYKDGVYIEGTDHIEAEMIKIIYNLTDRQRKETLKYLNLCTDSRKLSDAQYIAFNNGIYNVVDGSFSDFTSSIVVTNKIPHNYVPEAYNELCDKTLNKLACYDKDIRALLEEMIGYTFYRRNELRKSFILTGEKRNGKSTFLDLINALLGEENISALDIKELNRTFKTAELVNKLANIGDDISDDFIPDGAIFKKLVSGNRVNVERKGTNPFDFNNYAKFLFSANNIPKMKDRTGAILDRMIIVPFNAEFKDTDEDFDPYIKYKLMTEEVMSYLINIGIQGLKRVLENRKFTESKLVDIELREYEENNNPVLTFFNEVEESDIVNNSTQEVYAKYKGYCYANGLQAISNIEFSRQVVKNYDVDVKYKKINGKTSRIFVYKEAS